MELLEGLYSRRSIRNYTTAPVAQEQVLEIIKAGTWAPSGLNNQPWRFVVVRDRDVKQRLAQQTKYGRIINEAPVCIAVFLDREAVYHEVKDLQAMGACIQNMLLAAHAMGLGAVWLGEILNKAGSVREILEAPPHLDLMAVAAIGHPAGTGGASRRKGLSEVLLREL